MTQNQSQVWLCPDLLFDGETLRSGMALGLSQGRTTLVIPVSQISPDSARLALRGTLSPGFVDLQVNGGGDALLNNTPTPEAQFRFGIRWQLLN